MKKQILYLGDTAIKEAASYLAGIMTYHNLTFDYLASDKIVSPEMLNVEYRAIIISDYPSANFPPGQLDLLTKKISKGTGLLMIGGWESFTGLNREYTQTTLAEVLPVFLQPTDDRINCPQPCLIEKNQDHEIIATLPFDQHPPTIGGFNLLRAKPQAETILSARRFSVSRSSTGYTFKPFEKSDPLLVVGHHGQGRVTAFASDVAPHWVGGLVDWGDTRVCAQAQNANAIEVGNWYAQFFANVVKWTAGLI
ncbi:MAG: glutamine amidotransferase [Phycisphaerae bacterium]